MFYSKESDKGFMVNHIVIWTKNQGSIKNCDLKTFGEDFLKDNLISIVNEHKTTKTKYIIDEITK